MEQLLHQILSRLETLDREIRSIRAEMATKEELAAIRAETKEELASIRAEMATKEELGTFRQEVAAKFEELKQTIADHRIENIEADSRLLELIGKIDNRLDYQRDKLAKLEEDLNVLTREPANLLYRKA